MTTVEDTIERVARELPPLESEDGYLTDEWLEALAAHEFNIGLAARFLVHELPIIEKHVSCLRVVITETGNQDDDTFHHVVFVTGGWSGAEALIGTMLDHFWIRHFHSRWLRGGQFEFEVPANLLADKFASLPGMKSFRSSALSALHALPGGMVAVSAKGLKEYLDQAAAVAEWDDAIAELQPQEKPFE